MRKKSVIRVAWLLIVALLFSVMPVDKIHAAEVTEPVEENEQVEEEQTEEEQTEEDAEGIENIFNYLLINQPEQQVGEEKTVVISLGDGSENIEAMELYVKDEAGTVYTLQSEKNEEGIYLFQKTFAAGVYYIESIKLTMNGIEEVYVMSEIGINAYFSVGEECPEEEKSEHIEVESIPSEEVQVETSVVTIDENGETTSEETITEALEEAAEEEISTFSVTRAVKEDVIVVLDPGHDSTHTGASYSGIKEHVATLKIAQYCKEELETYGGVKVYLTRDTASCPFPGSANNIDDIKKRVKWSSEKGADAYISIHLNASTSASTKGAEVYYHSKSTAGKNLSQQVQDELVEIGLYDRKIKSNNNYAVTNTAQSYGFPGIIIEHAFLSNTSDVEKYLSSNAKLKKVGAADAAGIAEYFKLPKIGTKVSMAEAVYTVTNAAVSEQVLSVEEEEKPLFSVSEQLASQRFELVSAGDKYYYIVAEDTGKVLGVTGGTVQMEVKNADSADQKWMFLESGSDYYHLCSVSGKYLTASESEVSVTDVANTPAQQWKLEKASYRSVEGLTPKLVSVKNSNEAVAVNWKELTGAEGYKVLRKTADTDWKVVGTVKGETTTSYVDKTAPANIKCTYTVKAYKGETESLYNKTGLSVTTPVKKTYIQYRTTTSVNYRTGPGTSYSKAGTLAKSKVIEVEKGYSKTANGLKWYRFKMNSKNYYIAAKYLKKVVVLSKPTLVSAKNSSGSVIFKWKKVSNAKGYYVYRKVSGGSYAKIATIKSGSTVQYKDTTVKPNKKYYYTVRAYNGLDKSGYNSGKSVTTPKEILVKYKTTTKVNYRSGAGTKYTKKGTLAKGKKVSVVKGWSKTANGLKWYKIKINGKYYYIAAKYLKKV